MLIPDPRTAVLLGSYDDRDEYQIDRTLVWVCFSSPLTRDADTAEAFRQLPSILQAIPEVIEKAVALLREQSPDFWRPHDLAGTCLDLVSVWGIWVYPPCCRASYQVSENHCFDPPKGAMLPAFNDEPVVYISRSGDGIVTIDP